MARGNPLSPLFIASIGNPPPAYRNTLHSAGHTVLAHIASLMRFSPFRRDRSLGNGQVSYPVVRSLSLLPSFARGAPAVTTKRAGEGEGDDGWTLWQSSSLMNVSGVGLGAAWRTWQKQLGEAAAKNGVLVVIHDELEKPLGKVSMRREGSARGHNGIKSIQASLPNTPFIRIGIGIGRPQSREPEDVARYVLRKMTEKELDAIENSAGEVISLLRKIEEGR